MQLLLEKCGNAASIAALLVETPTEKVVASLCNCCEDSNNFIYVFFKVNNIAQVSAT